jgi:hypothetical protein
MYVVIYLKWLKFFMEVLCIKNMLCQFVEFFDQIQILLWLLFFKFDIKVWMFLITQIAFLINLQIMTYNGT